MRLNEPAGIILLCCLLFTFFEDVRAQKVSKKSEIEVFQCQQDKAEQDSFITEAERNQYTYRRIEFIGNTYTRDRELRKRLKKYLEEGDIFSRPSLEKGLGSVSEMKTIYPIRLENIQIFLDKKKKDLDLVFCIKEKPNKKH